MNSLGGVEIYSRLSPNLSRLYVANNLALQPNFCVTPTRESERSFFKTVVVLTNEDSHHRKKKEYLPASHYMF